MSNSASFWAAKSSGVKSSAAPASVDTNSFKQVKPRTQPEKTDVVLNGTTSSVKNTDWADSDDDEEFLATFTATDRTQDIEKTVTAKDVRIIHLESALQAKNDRIAELEGIAAEHQRSLERLTGSAEMLTTQVEDMKKENHKQYLHMKKLVAEVDEKDRRIGALESEVDEYSATISELSIEDSSTQVSSGDGPITPGGEGPVKENHTELKIALENKAESVTKSEVTSITGEAVVPTTPTPEPKSIPHKTVGPAVDLTGFPVFATPSTVKQTAPPPPAPKLKMGVDLSKFGKKPTSKKAARMKKTTAPPRGIAKDGSAPTIDPLSDIRTKRHEERVLFANGPQVQVKMGDTALTSVPKYVLMQCSAKAYKHFSDNPDASTFVLPADSIDIDAGIVHLDWMKEMTYQGRVYSTTLHSDEMFDDKNLQLCRAARVLGLNNMYVGHFTKTFCDRIRANTASYDFLSKIAALAYLENDPIYDCLANNLANHRVHNSAKKPVELDALLERHADLKIRVTKIEKHMRKKQNGAKGRVTKGANVPAVIAVGKNMDA